MAGLADARSQSWMDALPGLPSVSSRAPSGPSEADEVAWALMWVLRGDSGKLWVMAEANPHHEDFHAERLGSLSPLN